jgi:hypothetical protein
VGWPHPLGMPIFVVTHEPPEERPHAGFTFVTDGVTPRVLGDPEVVEGDGVTHLIHRV